ncbi:MAG: SDR family oxidoreductase [Bacteroidota bacterium]
MAQGIESVSIIGCGWLGYPLAKRLLASYQVHGSTTSLAKKDQLSHDGIRANQLILEEDLSGDFTEKIFQSDLTVISIPPGRRNPDVNTWYPSAIQLILNRLRKYRDHPSIIYISSTGVYPDSFGEVTESTQPSPSRPSGQAVLSAEKLVSDASKNWTILRLSGLAGLGREPGRWFAGREEVEGGDTPVNMVHLDDCLNVIELCIKKSQPGSTYNVCADEHPVKKDFYTAQADKLGLQPATWQRGTVPFKIVSNRAVKMALDYNFVHPDPIHF